MRNKKYIVNKKCVLEKFSGKGGWTYIPLPKHKLLSMGNNKLFLPIKVEIRKTIKNKLETMLH